MEGNISFEQESGSQTASSSSFSERDSAMTSSTLGSSQTLSTPPSSVNIRRTPRRYPSNLSKNATGATKPAANSPRNTTPHQYQSLEELLRVNGYRETRIFTPEAERIAQAARRKSGNHGQQASVDSEIGPQEDDEGVSPVTPSVPVTSVRGVGEMVVSLLSGWIPNGTKTLGRVQTSSYLPAKRSQQDLDDQENDPRDPSTQGNRSIRGQSRSSNRPPLAPSQILHVSNPKAVPRTAHTDALEASLRKLASSSKVQPVPPLIRRQSSRDSGSSNVTPSSSSSTIRPSARQILFQKQRLATSGSQHSLIEPQEPVTQVSRVILQTQQLRHARSAPVVRIDSQPQLARRNSAKTGHGGLSGGFVGYNGSFLSSEDVTGLTPNRNLHAQRSTRSLGQPHMRRMRSKANTRSRSRLTTSNNNTSQSPDLSALISPSPVASLTVTKTEAVLCRSTPPSRSASRAGTSERVLTLGNRSSDSSTLILSPSLSPNPSDPLAGMWTSDAITEALSSLKRYIITSQPVDIGIDDSDSETDAPNLKAIMSSYHSPEVTHMPTIDPLPHAHDNSSLSAHPHVDPAIHRQRSIRSLRAHQNRVRTATPGEDGVPPLPSPSLDPKIKSPLASPLPENGYEAWVDGADWTPDSLIRGLQGANVRKRGILPWLNTSSEAAQ